MANISVPEFPYCIDCHTYIDPMSREFTLLPTSGGFYFVSYVFTEGFSFISLNLAPAKETEIMLYWPEDTVIKCFKILHYAYIWV